MNHWAYQKGFSLIEVITVLLIGMIVSFAALVLFNRGHQAAINQGEIMEMNQNLSYAAHLLRRSIFQAGFGFQEDPDYAIRTFADVPEANPENFGVVVNGANHFTKKALAASDAILTVHALPGDDGNPGCEKILLDVTQSEIPTNPIDSFRVRHCISIGLSTRCSAVQQQPTDTTFPWNRTAIFSAAGRSFLLINRSAPNASVTLKVTRAEVNVDLGFCSGAPYLEIEGTGKGLQVGTNWTYAGTGSEVLSGRLIEAKFYFLDKDQNLYAIPGNYFGGEDSMQEREEKVLVARPVERFDLQFFMHDDGADRQSVEGSAIGDNPPADGLPDTADIRQVDVVIRSRSLRFDPNYQSTPDHYRRRTLHENILSKNLFHFGNGRGTYREGI